MSGHQVRAQVLELRSAGLGFQAISERLSLDPDTARDLYREALDDTDTRFDVELEVHRIDRLLTVAWTAAVKGDLGAMDRVNTLSTRRERLIGWTREQRHEMREAFDQTVEHLPAVDRDRHGSLIAAGRVIADRIDAALCQDDRTEITKSLYLIPHLVNVLRELGATPTEEERLRALMNSSGRASGEESPSGGGKLAELRSRERQRNKRAG